MFALPFLPAEHITPVFAKLRSQARGEKLEALMLYIEETWISNPVWPVSSWSVFGQSVRTNNDVEGWHHRINRKAKKGNLPFYLMVTLLYREAKLLPTQRKLVSEGKLRRRQRKTYKTAQGKVFGLWKRYTDNELSVGQLLKRCGGVYGPLE